MNKLEIQKIQPPKIDINCYHPSKTSPIKQVEIMDPDTFEIFINEWLWAVYKGKKYESIHRIGGSGDKGRDILAYYPDKSVDYYQCKHYKDTLSPSEIMVEFGKLCYYTYTGEIIMPHNYYIVASRDVGPTLHDLIQQNNSCKSLNKKLIDTWDDKCKNKITNKSITLDDNLKQYIIDFDFSVVKIYPILDIVNEYLDTKYGQIRFGMEPPKKPSKLPVPETQDSDESRYITALLQVYSKKIGKKFESIIDVKEYDKAYRHLTRQRETYFAAETIRREVRDVFTNNDEFEKLKNEIFSGIVEVYEDDYESGCDRLKNVLSQAVSLPSLSTLLDRKFNWITSDERKGVCHMLVNDQKISGWEKE